MTKDLRTSPEELHRIATSMVEAWEGRPAKVSLEKSTNQYTLVLGLAGHAHRLGRAALSLFSGGFTLEALPIVRAMYEHAVITQWLALHADGAVDFVNEYGRQKKAHVGTLEKSRLSDMKAAAKVLTEDFWDPISSDSAQQAKNTEALLDDLHPAGAEAYFYYRLLSSLTHPTGKVIDQYLTKNPLTWHIREKATESAFIWMFIACLSLVLSGTAVDMLEEGRPRRTALEEIAQRLGTPAEFSLSEKFHERMAKKNSNP